MNRHDIREVIALLHPLRQRVAGMVARGVVRMTGDASKQQRLQLGVLSGEIVGDGAHYQSYGFSSVPLAGAEAVVLFPYGDRARPLVVAVSDRRYRPTGGEPGEVTVYGHTGARITLTKDGDIVVQPAAGREVLVRSEGGEAGELATKADVQSLRDWIAGEMTVVCPSGTSTPGTVTSPPDPDGTSVLKAE